MKRYRKVFEPEAMYYTNDCTLEEVQAFCGNRRDYDCARYGVNNPDGSRDKKIECFARVVNQRIEVYPNHWIIKGINGCIYPVSDEVFRRTYEEIQD